MSPRIIEITEMQARLLVNLAAARDRAQREHDVAFTAICAGHGIDVATNYYLEGTNLSVVVPDVPEPEIAGGDDGA